MQTTQSNLPKPKTKQQTHHITNQISKNPYQANQANTISKPAKQKIKTKANKRKKHKSKIKTSLPKPKASKSQQYVNNQLTKIKSPNHQPKAYPKPKNQTR